MLDDVVSAFKVMQGALSSAQATWPVKALSAGCTLACLGRMRYVTPIAVQQEASGVL